VRKFKFEKLVRDKIAENIVKSGGKVHQKALSEKDFLKELKKKVIEEALELPKTQTKRETLSELADIQEVINTILKMLNVRRRDLRELQKIKSEKTGEFEKRVYIKNVEVPEDSKWVKYYKENKDKYPEITPSLAGKNK
jgi:predicted house-cleaning noncanonical NTP pyrophosphatase (MazG superfamily)